MRYRAKPLEIDAVLWTGDLNSLPIEWRADHKFRLRDEKTLLIETLEGPTWAKSGEHYVVRGTVGEYYPVRKDIFESKYMAVE